MANKVKGEVEIELSGKTYVLRPEFEGMVQAESLIGRPLTVIFFEWGKQERPPSLKEIAAIIWGGLLWDKSLKGVPMSFDEVGRKIQGDGVFNFIVPAVTLVKNTLTPPQDEEEAPSKKKKDVKSLPSQPLGGSTIALQS